MAEFVSLFMMSSCVIGVIVVMMAIKSSKESLKPIVDSEEDLD